MLPVLLILLSANLALSFPQRNPFFSPRKTFIRRSFSQFPAGSKVIFFPNGRNSKDISDESEEVNFVRDSFNRFEFVPFKNQNFGSDRFSNNLIQQNQNLNNNLDIGFEQESLQNFQQPPSFGNEFGNQGNFNNFEQQSQQFQQPQEPQVVQQPQQNIQQPSAPSTFGDFNNLNGDRFGNLVQQPTENPNEVLKNRGTFISELPGFPVPSSSNRAADIRQQKPDINMGLITVGQNANRVFGKGVRPFNFKTGGF